MSQEFQLPKRSWPKKFRDAFRGLGVAVRGQSSFVVHLIAAAAAIVAGIVLQVNLVEWCVLTLCMAIVLAAETFNTALESMAKAVDDRHNEHLRNALDISSAAVLVTAMGAAVAGAAIFVCRACLLFGW